MSLLLSMGVMCKEKARKSLLYEELTMSEHNIDTFVFYDELSRMGDFGEGGGVGKWWKTFRENIVRRFVSIGDLDVRLLNGNEYFLVKSNMPVEQFKRLEIKPIVSFSTRDNVYSIDDVFLYYVRKNTNVNRPVQMKHLDALELLDGTIILKEEILAVTVKLMFEESE